MAENKTAENKEWQKEEAHLRECRALIASNVEEYRQQYEARHRETKELFDAVQSGNVELYDQMMTSRSLEEHSLNQLNKNQAAYDKPFFGRIDYRNIDERLFESIYIGKHGVLRDKTNVEIVDWRAPISSVYYENEIGQGTYSSFEIIGEKETKFLLECQSTADSSMLIRIFEYATQIALDQGELENNVLKVEIPRSAILFLRSNGATPDKMTIEIKTPGGVNSFDVPVMKAQKYSIDDIFEKGLLFLIPFYIFSHESRFQEYELDEDALKELKIEYMEIVKRLDSLLENGSISVYTKKMIVEMSNKVVNHLAQKYDNVKEGVTSIMGGKVLEYEAKQILNEGKKEGRIEGRIEQARETAQVLRGMGISEEKIAKAVNVSVGVLKEWFSAN